MRSLTNSYETEGPPTDRDSSTVVGLDATLEQEVRFEWPVKN